MRRRLKKHQQLALAYCLRERHPALFMEMRLGKTLVTIRRLSMYLPQQMGKYKGQHRFLIVAPNSALGSWEHELELEGFGDSVAHIQGTSKKRLDMLKEGRTWNLINKEGFLSIPEMAEEPWDAVVLDESHFIKSPKPHVTKYFLRNFRDAKHRWVLTGTPNPQNDMEFWPQMAFLDGKAFGCNSYWAFRVRYFQPDFNGYDWSLKPGAATRIKKYLARRAFVMQRKEAGLDVPKVFERRLLTLPPQIRKTYDEIEEIMLLEIEGKIIKSTKYAPVRMIWLRQLCNGFVDGKLVWPGKINELTSLLTGELARDSVVVWFSYNQEIQAVYKHLQKNKVSVCWADGSVKLKDRIQQQKDFNAGKFRVYLLQQAIAQTGMNLSVADTAIYFCPPLGTLAWRQTQDRILDVYKKGPLLIINLCVQDSVDTSLLDSLEGRTYKGKWNLSRVYKLMRERVKSK